MSAKKNSPFLKVRISFLIAFLFWLSSCHSDYVTINFKLMPGACWSEDSAKVAFVASRHAFRKAEGLSKFPDGGNEKTLMYKMDLYLYNKDSMNLEKLIDFEDLTKSFGLYRTNWIIDICFQDSINLHCSIKPIGGWEGYMGRAKNVKDSAFAKLLKDKYENDICFNLLSKKTTPLGFSDAPCVFNKAILSEIKTIIDDVPLKLWDFDIQKIYPKDNREYIEETIYLKNDCELTRIAIIEQIISDLPKKDIEALLREMKEYKNSLEGLEQTEYRIYSKRTYEAIENLLEEK